MFATLGRLMLRFRFIVLALWLIAALWMATQAPVLRDVAISEQMEFLPEDVPSMQAQKILSQAFEEEGSQGSAILVFSNPDGLSQADNAYARHLTAWLTSPDGPHVIHDVSSIFNRPGTEALFVSPDATTMLVSVGFSSGPLDVATTEAVKAIRRAIADSPPPQGLDIHLSGMSAISVDQRTATIESVDRTTYATIVLVVFVLLLIYRSPVASLAPLITIGLAYIVSRGILGYLATWGWKISSYLDAFIIVLIFGVGTDYCLFILSRFREELGRQANRSESIVVTMSAIGAVITASAATVIVALAIMVSGRFGMLQTMGPAMALSVLITLIAGLTLTPAIVSIMGRHLFWPRHDEAQTIGGRNWQRVAEFVTTRRVIVAAATVLFLLLPYLALPQLKQSFDFLAELPKSTDSVQGFNALSAHFDPGELLPATVLVRKPGGNVLAELEKIQRVTEMLEGAPQVQRVRSVLQPTGDESTAVMFHADYQVKQAAEALDGLVRGLDDPQSLMGSIGGGQQASMADLQAFLQDLGQLPGVGDRAGYRDALARTQAVDAALSRFTEMGRLSAQLEGLGSQFAQMATGLQAGSAATSASMTSAVSDLKNLAAYLEQLGQAQPALAAEASFRDAVAAVAALGADLAKAQDLLLVTNQLSLLAEQLQLLSKSLESPLGLLALAGSSSEQLQALAGYYLELGKAFPAIAASPAYLDALLRLNNLDTAAKQMLASPPTDLQAAVNKLKAEVDGLAAATTALRQSFATQNPTAQFTPSGLQALAGPQVAATAKTAQRLADDLSALGAVAKARFPDARFIPKNIPLSPEIRQALSALKEQLVGLQGSLNRLSSDLGAGKPVFFLPQALLKDERMASLVTYFVSPDSASTRLTAVLKARPYSGEANRDLRALRPVVAQAAQETGLEVVIGGVPAFLADMQETLGQDFKRIAAFTVVGVLVVLIVLLRSLVAPIYLILTVLLSFGSTMGLSTLVFQDILGHSSMNYMIPIIVFVLLVALGADYNIFLMSRVREEAAGRGTREGIRVASAFTGAIITSCGIILAGTFAAMMFAPLQLLFQVGFAVAAGVLVDTFIIRAILVPALAAILNDKNWWPGRIEH